MKASDRYVGIIKKNHELSLGANCDIIYGENESLMAFATYKTYPELHEKGRSGKIVIHDGKDTETLHSLVPFNIWIQVKEGSGLSSSDVRAYRGYNDDTVIELACSLIRDSIKEVAEIADYEMFRQSKRQRLFAMMAYDIFKRRDNWLSRFKLNPSISTRLGRLLVTTEFRIWTIAELIWEFESLELEYVFDPNNSYDSSNDDVPRDVRRLFSDNAHDKCLETASLFGIPIRRMT